MYSKHYIVEYVDWLCMYKKRLI